MRVEMVSGVFLAIVILLTFNGSSGMSAGNDTYIIDVTPDEVWKHILHAYKIDFNAPSFLARGDVIFHLWNPKWSVELGTEPTVYGDFTYSDSEHTAAHKFAAEVGVEAYYGAFSAAASMATSMSTDRSIKTVRIDSFIRATKYQLSAKNRFNTNPETFLTTNFKKAVKNLKVEEIEDIIGIFYIKKMDLGGEVKKSYTMQATTEDNENKVSAEVRAGFGGAMFGASAKANVGVSSRLSNKNSEMKISWAAKGGNTTLWLGVTFNKTSMAKIQGDWATSIVDANLYPFNYKLAPLWDLVKSVDEEKGADFKQYLVNKWKEALKDFLPTRFLGEEGGGCSGDRCVVLANGKDVILAPGESIKAENGEIELKMQTDGNLVLHCTSNGAPVWNAASNAANENKLVIKSTGEMVVVDRDNRQHWSNDKGGHSGGITLIAQNDNNMALYIKEGPIWSTRTYKKCH